VNGGLTVTDIVGPTDRPTDAGVLTSRQRRRGAHTINRDLDAFPPGSLSVFSAAAYAGYNYLVADYLYLESRITQVGAGEMLALRTNEIKKIVARMNTSSLFVWLVADDWC
jgi:hypothetical protein